MRIAAVCTAASIALALTLAACAQPQHQATPPAHARPASPSRPQVLAAVLNGASAQPFAFQAVRLREPGELIESRTPLKSSGAIARIKRSGAKRVLVFLAGFNTTFAHGAADAARIAQLLDPRTLLIYADWGSQGKATAYRRDGRSAKRNAPAFEELLDYLRTQLGTGEVLDVFAHSMGARVAIQGLALSSKEHRPLALQNVILAAPDLGISDYLAAMHQLGAVSHGTIYVSRRDKALLVSSLLHLHHRLGQVAIERLNLPRTDIIDVTASDHSKDGHGYAIHDPAILRDIYAIVSGEPSPHGVWCRSKTARWVWLYCPR